MDNGDKSDSADNEDGTSSENAFETENTKNCQVLLVNVMKEERLTANLVDSADSEVDTRNKDVL